MIDNCLNGDVLSVIRIVKIITKILTIAAPILLIIYTIKEYAKLTISKEVKHKEVLSISIRRLIAAIVVFLSPTLIGYVFSIIDADTYEICLESATPEGIQKAYDILAEDKTNKARETLEMTDYNEALDSLEKASSSEQNKLKKELKETKTYIDLRLEITNLDREEEYSALKKKVNSVSDSKAKSKLTEELESKYKLVKNNTPVQIDKSESLVAQEETDSMKVSITKKDSYYITRIWVENPYQQLNKFDSPEYGVKLYKPGTLLEKAVAKKKLNNNLIIGFNASGFYLKDTYDAASVNKYSGYDKTSVGTLVITDGKQVRNAYDKAYKTWFIYGIDRNNSLRIFVDEQTNDTSAKKKWANKVTTKIRNTFTFASPLVENGQASPTSTNMPGTSSALNRQALCQVDNNNFVLITGSNLTRQNLIDIMLNLNCRTGVNLDGGGSIALLYKSKNSNSIQTIIGNGRALTEVAYFTEY